MAKKVNSTIKVKKSPNLEGMSDFKKSPWLEDYKDCFSFKIQPITQAAIDRLCVDLVTWAKNDINALRIEDFHFSKGICDGTYSRWKNKYENLGIAHKVAMNFLASRRELGALKKQYSETMVLKRQHAYDPEWDKDKQREKQDKIDIAIAVKKAAMEMSESKPQVIVLSELEYKKKEEACNE